MNEDLAFMTEEYIRILQVLTIIVEHKRRAGKEPHWEVRPKFANDFDQLIEHAHKRLEGAKEEGLLVPRT